MFAVFGGQHAGFESLPPKKGRRHIFDLRKKVPEETPEPKREESFGTRRKSWKQRPDTHGPACTLRL